MDIKFIKSGVMAVASVIGLIIVALCFIVFMETFDSQITRIMDWVPLGIILAVVGYLAFMVWMSYFDKGVE